MQTLQYTDPWLHCDISFRGLHCGKIGLSALMSTAETTLKNIRFHMKLSFINPSSPVSIHVFSLCTIFLRWSVCWKYFQLWSHQSSVQTQGMSFSFCKKFKCTCSLLFIFIHWFIECILAHILCVKKWTAMEKTTLNKADQASAFEELTFSSWGWGGDKIWVIVAGYKSGMEKRKWEDRKYRWWEWRRVWY